MGRPAAGTPLPLPLQAVSLPTRVSRWINGAVATAKNPTHKFAKPVFVGIVTLIVSDVHGDQTRVVKSITVT